MVKLFRRTGRKPGKAPGTITHIGEKRTEGFKIQVTDFNQEELTEKELPI